MTVILPSEDGFSRAAGRPRHSTQNQIAPSIGFRDYGESLVQPIQAVREAAEQCRVDCSLQDATRAFDEFTRALTAKEPDFDKWPERFTAEAKRLRDRFAADIPDGPSRDRFDAGFDLFAKAKAVETRGLATHKRIVTNRAELDRALAGYGDTISRAMNPISADFALKQGEEAIRNQVTAKVLSEDEGNALAQRYRTDIATRRAAQFTQDDPAEAAKELGKAKGGLFSDLDREDRRRLAGQARQTAEAQTVDAERMVFVEDRRVLAEKTLRRDAFLRDLDERAEKGEASLADVIAAARDGVLDPDESVARMKLLANRLAERDAQAKRVFTVMAGTDTFLDPRDGDDRRAADIYWQDTVLPMVENLPETERIRFEDAAVLNTGIVPKPAADSVLAGLLSPEPAPRVAAARRVRLWLLAQPPIPVDESGLRNPEFETLRPYLDLPITDARMVELADRDREREEAVSGGIRMPNPVDPAQFDEPIETVDLGTGEEDESSSSSEPTPGSDAVGGDIPEPFSPGEAQDWFEEELSDPDTRAALREQLLKDIYVEAERSGLSSAEVLERQQEVRDALPADPAQGTQIAFAPVIAAGAAGAGSASGISSAVASALAVIGLGGLLKGDTHEGGNTTKDSISRRTEDGDDDGGDRGRGRSDDDGLQGGTNAGDPREDPPEKSPRGRKARDSSKNERHGDGGRARESAKEQLEDLDRRIENAPNKKTRKRLRATRKRVKQSADKKRQGYEHTTRRKR